MSVNFSASQTKDNLMRAFAGESQARNRYEFAAAQAKKNGLAVIQEVFRFTADQEKQHAKIFYRQLEELAGQSVIVDGSYPVDLSDSILELLRFAQHNEYEEHDDVYRKFEEIAREEGFQQAASAFHMIGSIEAVHGNRFGYYADLLEQNRLFVSQVEIDWMCLNCGFVYNGTHAPDKCPVCDHDKGFFVRLELAPYTALENRP